MNQKSTAISIEFFCVANMELLCYVLQRHFFFTLFLCDFFIFDAQYTRSHAPFHERLIFCSLVHCWLLIHDFSHQLTLVDVCTNNIQRNFLFVVNANVCVIRFFSLNAAVFSSWWIYRSILWACSLSTCTACVCISGGKN